MLNEEMLATGRFVHELVGRSVKGSLIIRQVRRGGFRHPILWRVCIRVVWKPRPIWTSGETLLLALSRMMERVIRKI